MTKINIFWGMREDAIRQKVVETALSLLGIREGTIDHKQLIVDVYNGQAKLPRGYALKPTDPWCAAFVSVVGIMLGISDVILPEVGCGPMIELYKAQGRWEELDSYIPDPGDIVMYDWDAQKGECLGAPDHVGLVEWVKGNRIGVIEGNYDNQVKRREICVEYVKIRGFCVPDYASLVQGFTDVSEGAWYRDEVARAAELGIILGNGDGTFAPEQPITRAEAAAMMVRLYDILRK